MQAIRKPMGLSLFPVMLGVLMAMSAAKAMAGTEEGIASYYADALDGNLNNNKQVTVRINDRGPHAKKLLIDVSGAAAKQLGLLDSGTAKVRLEIQD